MENVAVPMDKDNPVQKTEVTTSIKEDGANIQGDDEPKKTAPIADDMDERDKQPESSRSDVGDKNETQKLQGEVAPDETKLAEASKDVSHNFGHIEEQRDDNSTKSSVTVEEGEIVLDVLLDQQSALVIDTHDKTEPILNKSLDNHPYRDLLLTFEPSLEQLTFVSEIDPPKSLQETPLIDVDNKDDLESLINDLKNEKEIGVDVEWSDHGYEALTCLVQLSSKDKDYIIDAIALKRHTHLLNDIFTDPTIVKIFHAANNDLKWLQQDLDLFVVNMFDTQRAMRALGYSKLGLDFALQRYKIVKDKSMQRADFRKRPLPPKYKDYARTDSHFLINMYQTLKNELIESDLLMQVLNECNNDCKVVHEKIADGPYVSVREDILQIHDRQLVALEKLNQWRHRIARYADINTGAVLSKNNMKSLALELPVDAAAILRVCKTAHVKEHLQEIIAILSEAKGQKVFGLMNESPKFEKFGAKGGFSNKRKADQTDFGDHSGQGPKKVMKFYVDDTNKSRGKPNRQNDLFDLRSTLRSNAFRGKRGNNAFRGNRGNRRGFRT